MEWWRWPAAAVEAVLLVILLLLWFDTLRDRPGWSTSRAARPPAIGALAVPAACLLVLILPLWLALVLIAIPASTVVAMAVAS
jgi:hypothetical protein